MDRWKAVIAGLAADLRHTPCHLAARGKGSLCTRLQRAVAPSDFNDLGGNGVTEEHARARLGSRPGMAR